MSCRLARCTTIVIALTILLSPAKAQEPQLELANSLERELVGGQTHGYQLLLATDQYLHLIVEQRGIDVVVTVFGPDGKKLAEVDSPNGTEGPEPIRLIAEASGNYRIEVRSLEKTAALGRYEVKIAALRIATAQDRNRLAAEKTFVEAERLRRRGTAESLRKSLEKYEEALPLWRVLAERLQEATTLHVMGRVYNALGEPQNGLAYLNQALPLWRAVGDRSGEASALTNIGGIYISLGEGLTALDYYHQALPLWRAAEGRLEEVTNLATTAGAARAGEATALNGIAVIYASWGERQKALDYYHQALPLWRSVGDRGGEAITLSNLGEIYSSLGEGQQALDYYQQALPLNRSLKDRRGEAYALKGIGVSYHILGETPKALDSLNQALSLCRMAGDREGEATTLNEIGLIYNALGEPQKALDSFSQALLLLRAVGARIEEADTLNNIGSVYHALRETQKAMDSFNQALPIWRAVGSRGGEARALYYLALAEKSRDNLSAARARIEEALNLIEFMRANLASQELRTSYVAARQDYYKAYLDLLMEMERRNPGQGFALLALQASERARARSLLETLTEARADLRQGVAAALLETERRLQQQLNSKEQARMQLLARPHTPEQAAAAAQELRALTTQYSELQTQIRTSSPHYAALTQPQPLALSELQQVLAPDTLLLEYALGEERSYLWAVSPEAVTSYELPKRTEIEAAARSFYQALSAANGTPAAESGAKLSQMLLAPVAAQLGNKRLLIVADGALQYVPFAALPAPRDEGRGMRDESEKRTPIHPSSLIPHPLIGDHEIIILPSAASLVVLRQELSGRKPAAKALALFADPVFAADDTRLQRAQTTTETRAADTPLTRALREAGLTDTNLRIPRLPGTRREAAAITTLVPTAERKQALDFDASRAAATSAELSQYRILHFATHGLLNSQHPELSGLVLSLVDAQGKPQDGFLRLHEIYNLKLPAELVVLSACQTGLGKEIKGEGLVGLTRGFMYAGAARVMASLWKVDDRATAELMKTFYQGLLKDGLRPAAALRAAQLALWKQARWREPYYWAAFVLQGEWK